MRIKSPHIEVWIFFARHRMQPITRELQTVSFLLACNIFTVQPRNFNDGNTLTPTVGRQPFATERELLCQLDISYPTPQYKTIQQAPCCCRSSGKDAGRSSIDAIEAKPCKQKPNTLARTLVTKLFWMGQGKLGRCKQHKKATPHSSPCQNEQQTTGGMEFLHINDTHGTY